MMQNWRAFYTIAPTSSVISLKSVGYLPLDAGHKLNKHKTFGRRPGALLSVLCAFNIRPASKRYDLMSMSDQSRKINEL